MTSFNYLVTDTVLAIGKDQLGVLCICAETEAQVAYTSAPVLHGPIVLSIIVAFIERENRSRCQGSDL